MILAEIAYQLLELDVGDISEVSGCMARIDEATRSRSISATVDPAFFKR